MLQEKDRAVKRSELLTAFADDVKKFGQQCGHLPAGPPPANETQPQKKLLSLFIAAPTTAAASATLPQMGEAAVPCSFSNKKAFIGKHYAAEQELGKHNLSFLSNPRPRPMVRWTNGPMVQWTNGLMV